MSSVEASDPASLPGVRERLFEAGIETMARRGYIHFPSKQHLLFEISRFGHTQAIEAVRRARQQPGGPSDRLMAVVSELAALHAEQYKVARVAQYELAALREEHLAEIHELRRAVRSAVRATIQEGVDEGCFYCDDVTGTTLAIISMCVDIARWFDPAGSRTAQDLSATLASLALRIVSADPLIPSGGTTPHHGLQRQRTGDRP
jgi:AcrR family transcriptional regulator